ncbi:MAG: prefoldin subunit alpha [Candidatus Lokiarchaeota archaeon]|nr:prefoldin subunit alpha [Candidatus Lokiarchaeota archaeon]
MEQSQNFQRQLSQYRYLQEQREIYQNQFEMMNASLLNFQNSKKTIQNIMDGVKDDDEILIPIGGIVSIKASIKDTNNALLFVGQDIVIERSLGESIEFIDKLVEKYSESMKIIIERLQSIELALQGMGEFLQGALNQKQ